MGNSQAPLGPRLGRLHAWRDRGAVYVEGIRTSFQAALLGAGVARWWPLETKWAIAFGLAVFVALEGSKLLLGALDYRFHVIHAQQGIVAEANPIIMRQLSALEEMASVARRAQRGKRFIGTQIE